MKSKKAFISHVLLQILAGLVISFLTSLLIYFKQKEYLHLGVVLFLVFVIYYSGNFIKIKIQFSPFTKLAGLFVLLTICWLGPQFIYQIRPYTFYISGFAMAGIVLVAITSEMLADQKTMRFPWYFGAFMAAFIIGYMLPWDIIQYFILVLSVLVTVLYLSRLLVWMKVSALTSLVLLFTAFFFFSKPLNFHEEQVNYEDKVLYSAETQFHKLVITKWHQDQWVFIDKLKNLSSIDEYLFYEPMAHSVFRVGNEINNVLVIGGENGCLIREVLAHESVQRIDVISYDTLLRNIGMEVEFFTELNQHAYKDQKVQILHENILEFVSRSNRKYDAIFIDLPDPRSIETNQYYTLEFYERIKNILAEKGVMITQAGSPYFATQAYFSIGWTIEKAGFYTLPIHNQILTLGEWGWYVCSLEMEKNVMKYRMTARSVQDIETKWFNEEAAKLVSAFGKIESDTSNLGINTLENPLVYQYYLKGNWELD